MKYNVLPLLGIISIIIIFVILYIYNTNTKEGFNDNQFLNDEKTYFEAREDHNLPTIADADKFYKYDDKDDKLILTSGDETNSDKADYEPVDKMVSRCKNIKSCDELDGTDCGYCFFNDKFYYGDKNGPKTDVCPGGWVNTKEECLKRRERNVCSKITKCHDMIGDAAICAWCPTKNIAIPYKMVNGKPRPKYNEDTCSEIDPASGETIGLILQKECSTFGEKHPCVGPNETTGPHSQKCLNHLWTEAGCSLKGSEAPKNNSSQSKWWNERGWKSIFSDMKQWYEDAVGKNGWQNVKSHHKGCFGTEPNPCDPKYGNTLECYQKEFIKNGCSKEGKGYPKTEKPNKNISDWNNYIETVRKNANNTDLEYDKRNSNYEICYGKELPKPKGIAGVALHPNDFTLYGSWISGRNTNKPVDKIITEGDRYIFISQRDPFVKVVKTDSQLNNQESSYFRGELKEYGKKTLINAPKGAYNIRLRTNVKYVGCFKDDPSRAMTNLNKVMTYDDAVKYVRSKGYKYLGLQDATAYGRNKAQVFASNTDEYKKYGSGSCVDLKTGEKAGGAWANAVYKLK